MKKVEKKRIVQAPSSGSSDLPGQVLSVELSEDEVRMALHELEDIGLAAPVRGTESRVAKYAHHIGEVFHHFLPVHNTPAAFGPCIEFLKQGDRLVFQKAEFILVHSKGCLSIEIRMPLHNTKRQCKRFLFNELFIQPFVDLGA